MTAIRTTITLLLLSFTSLIAEAQPSDRLVNSYILKDRLFPISMPDILTEPDLIGNVETIDMVADSSSSSRLQFNKNNVCALSYAGEPRMRLLYKHWGLSKIEYLSNDGIVDQLRFIRIFPYELVYSKSLGLSSIAIKGFGNISRMSMPGLRKTKIKYKNGRVHLVVCYGRDYQSAGTNIKYIGYCTYDYPNDTTITETKFDKNDSLSAINTHTFNSKGNILFVKSLIKKGVTRVGLNGSLPPNDADEYLLSSFTYEFDCKDNWIRQDEFRSGTLYHRKTRIIKYR